MGVVDHQKISHIKGDALFRNTEETSARTRPFSFEEVMLERKNKKAAENVKSEASDMRESEKNDLTSGRKQSTSNNIYKLTRDLKDTEEGESRMKEEISICKNEKSSRHGYNVKNNIELKHEHGEINGEKQTKSDTRNHYRSRTDEGLKVEFEKESRKNRTKYIIANDKDMERHKKSKRGSKRIHQSEEELKIRSEVDNSSRKKRDHLPDFEYSEKVRRRDTKRSKSRRSRSREHYQRRGQSASVSPRTQKRSYSGESVSHFKDRPGRLYSNLDKQRTSPIDVHDNRLCREHGSGLGGYSPRKRRTHTNVRSPSPTVQSLAKKISTRDQHPTNSSLGSVQLTNTDSFSSSLPITNTVKVQSASQSQKTAETMLNASADTIQLTQATRPIRRLYIENIPPSASEKMVTEWLNNKLVSSVSNHVQRTPCISCIINKEKCQAVVEFLTPDDATSALSFNGKSFAGSVLKIRRPRDFIDTTTEAPEKLFAAVEGNQKHHSKSEIYAISDVVKDSPQKIFIGGISKFLSSGMLMDIVSAFGSLKAYHFEVNEELNEPCAFVETEAPEKLFAAVEGNQKHHSKSEIYAISDVVKDSPQKIFIGGISKFLSSGMLMDIVSAFGSLKAYHFEVNEELNEPCAFVEYMDRSVTLNALIGLNGMKLGGRLLTVVKALPDCQLDEEKVENDATYIVPENARPLLESPTQVLKLKNVFNPEEFTLLSESELEEILEDVRLECARFGTVKSINTVRCSDFRDITSGGLHQIESNDTGTGKISEIDSRFCGEVMLQSESQSIEVVSQEPSSVPEKHYMETVEGKKSCTISEPDDSASHVELLHAHFTEDEDAKTTDKQGDSGLGNSEGIPEEPNPENVQQIHKNNADMEMTAVTDKLVNHVNVFEPGSILVEFLREEATSMAAHCLHGRLYDSRVVSASYVAYNAFSARFPR